MFEDFLNHRCDIYHLEEEGTETGYGIKAAETMKPAVTPDLENVPCHFHLSGTPSLTQEEPYTAVSGAEKLSLPIGTDIRENDLVVDVTEGRVNAGYSYRAEVPRVIHGDHHIIVNIMREGNVRGAV